MDNFQGNNNDYEQNESNYSQNYYNNNGQSEKRNNRPAPCSPSLTSGHQQIVVKTDDNNRTVSSEKFDPNRSQQNRIINSKPSSQRVIDSPASGKKSKLLFFPENSRNQEQYNWNNRLPNQTTYLSLSPSVTGPYQSSNSSAQKPKLSGRKNNYNQSSSIERTSAVVVEKYFQNNSHNSRGNRLSKERHRAPVTDQSTPILVSTRSHRNSTSAESSPPERDERFTHLKERIGYMYAEGVLITNERQ